MPAAECHLPPLNGWWQWRHFLPTAPSASASGWHLNGSGSWTSKGSLGARSGGIAAQIGLRRSAAWWGDLSEGAR
jgi:hypothetical protein